jgi:hypothetical protein
MSRLVRGVGINDADYEVTRYKITTVGDKVSKTQEWTCPFYSKWVNMLNRCYNVKIHKNQPTYADCVVCDEWLRFSTFKKWMLDQDWANKQLDKDILLTNCKIYSPDTCAFVDKRVNVFLIESTSARGEYPIGVNLFKPSGRFVAKICKGSGTQKHLGYFDTAEEAHQCWLTNKLKLAKELASTIKDKRVADAIVRRYINYGSL